MLESQLYTHNCSRNGTFRPHFAVSSVLSRFMKFSHSIPEEEEGFGGGGGDGSLPSSHIQLLSGWGVGASANSLMLGKLCCFKISSQIQFLVGVLPPSISFGAS